MSTPETPTVAVTRRFTFSAAHRYARPEWSDAENRARYGPLATIHGHTYTLEATVRGVVDADGTVMPPSSSRRWGRPSSISWTTGTLERDVPALAGTITTGENLVVAFYRMIERALPPGRLVRVAVMEAENNRFEYGGTREAP